MFGGVDGGYDSDCGMRVADPGDCGEGGLVG